MNHKKRLFARGVTIIEMLLVMVITVIIFGVTNGIMLKVLDTWWKVNANADAQQQLYKAQSLLERDLSGAAFETEVGRETVAVQKKPVELVHLAGADGDVLWFLSAIDPLSGEFQRKDGRPHWQRNILYYAVTPKNLSSFGFSGSGLAVDGFEVSCPYKILVRKEIDGGDPTTPASPYADREALLPYDEIVPYLRQPDSYDVSTIADPNVPVRPVCGNLATFRADLNPTVLGVDLILQATALNRAKREGLIGSTDLTKNPCSQELKFTVFPPNRQGSAPTAP